MEHLKKELLSLTQYLQQFGEGQLQGLSYFIANAKQHVELKPQAMESLILSLSDVEMNDFLQMSSLWFPVGVDQISGSSFDTHVKEMALGFLMIYFIYLLKEIFTNMPWEMLLKVFEFLNYGEGQESYQYDLQVLQDVQQLMTQLGVDVLVTLKSELRQMAIQSPGLEHTFLPNLVQLEKEHFYLYQPLFSILQLTEEQMYLFLSVFPSLDPIQLMLITRMKEIGLNAATDIWFLFMKDQMNDQMMNNTMGNQLAVIPNVAYPQDEPLDPPLALEIVVQPPEKCVYKRNVRPNPEISIVGDYSENDGYFFVVPVLIRCDTFQEIPDQIAGDEKMKVTTNRTICFKKLKILSTSHQLNESHLSIRFELRHYDESNDSSYKVVSSVTSNPICVYSHSTQLKPSAKTKPSLQEIVPPRGISNGTTRVAILGNNFVDSPTTRVKFGDVEVIPIFHGSKTLICNTPKHLPGPVTVTVCNEPNRFSDPRTFIYDTPISLNQHMNYGSVPSTSFGL